MSSPAGPVVSNTTPIIVLAGLQLLDILPTLYGDIWIPAVVANEYDRGRRAAEPDIRSLPWMKVHPVATDPALAIRLDPGEADALSLAVVSNASLVILDERQARVVAQGLGLPVIGSLGVLVRAKERGLVAQVAPLIDQMIAQGRYISPSVRAQILRAAGEDVL